MSRASTESQNAAVPHCGTDEKRIDLISLKESTFTPHVEWEMAGAMQWGITFSLMHVVMTEPWLPASRVEVSRTMHFPYYMRLHAPAGDVCHLYQREVACIEFSCRHNRFEYNLSLQLGLSHSTKCLQVRDFKGKQKHLLWARLAFVLVALYLFWVQPFSPII